MWASFAAAGTTLGAGVLHELGAKGALLAALAATAGAVLVRRIGGPSVTARARTAIGGARALARRDAVSMAIVPWGILVQPDVAPRVLRWAAVKRVQVDMIHGRDGATPSTLWSVVTIETDHERLAGRTPGAVGIERLRAPAGGGAGGGAGAGGAARSGGARGGGGAVRAGLRAAALRGPGGDRRGRARL